MLQFLGWLGFTVGDERVQAGILTGLISFGGVVLTGGIALVTWSLNQRKERAERQHLREERREDLLRAMWSDIKPIWFDLYSQGTFGEKATRVRAAFADPSAKTGHTDATPYTPFVTRVSGTMFDERLISDVDVLKEAEIKPLVTFYHQIRMINQMADDMRSDRYRTLSLDRKEAVLVDLFLMEHKATELAEDAIRVLEDELNIRDRTGRRQYYAEKEKMDDARRLRGAFQ